MSFVTAHKLGENGRLGNQMFQIAATLSYAFDVSLLYSRADLKQSASTALSSILICRSTSCII